ncbi:lytic polysaccharide monooxygenase, partial [Micromonospora sp. ATA51]
MVRRRRALTAAALGGIPILASLALVSQAGAHGSMQSPVSRTYACFLEGPESPDSAACRAAVAAGGTQALYDWNEVNIADAAGRHRQIIPDGRLCSANRDKYRGFDLTRADWPATALPSGGTWTFAYRATAPHRGTFELYVTRDGYDPTRPLRWADLELFHTATDPALTDGAYRMTARLPQRAGRHLVYSIWQRSDSPEAFYTCSDVTFGQVTPTT